MEHLHFCKIINRLIHELGEEMIERNELTQSL